MKSDSLLTFVTFSDMRMKILFSLLEMSMDFAELRQQYGVTAACISPRIRELEIKGLIFKDDGKYRLTTTGRIIVKKLKKMINLFSLMETNLQFFNNHNLSIIPEDLLYRIGELGKCTLLENSIDNVNATDEIFNHISAAKSVMVVSSIFDHQYPELFLSIAQQKFPLSIMLTEHVYQKVKTDHSDTLHNYLKYDNAKLYVVDDMQLSFAVTDTVMSISLPDKNGTIDITTNLMSTETSALKWGEDLFNYYRYRSREIKSLL